jgi:hypothetical protein
MFVSRGARTIAWLATAATIAGICVACCSTAANPLVSPPQPSLATRTAANADGLPHPIVLDSTGGAFPRRLRANGESLVLNGSGLCEWSIFGIDLYRAALYLPRASRNSDEILASGGTAVIHLLFVRSLRREQLAAAFSAAVKANAEKAADHETAVSALNDLLSDVVDGQSLTFTMVPARGLLVQLDGRYLGTVRGDAFQRLFLRLYLGDAPPTEGLRSALLGGR